MTIVDVYSDPALPVLERAAQAVAYHYSDFIPESDLYQEAWEWRLRHPILVKSFLEPEEGSPNVTGLERAVRSYLESVARKEKAVSSGYHQDDESFYTPRVIAELLPLTADIEAALLPAAPSDDAPGRGSNPHGQGDFVTSLLDVRRAWLWTAFRGPEMDFIRARYIEDHTWDHIAGMYQVEVEEVQRRAAIGLRRMADFLGGLPPRQCKGDCECKEVS